MPTPKKSAPAPVAGATTSTSTPPPPVTLRPYQEKAVRHLVKRRGGALRAPTGAGKTVMALSACRLLGCKRVLILVRRYTGLITWMQNIASMHYAPLSGVVVMQKMPKEKRAAVWAGSAPVVICLYPTAVNDKVDIASVYAGFDMVIADECQAFTNRKTQTFKAMKIIVRDRMHIELTATMQQKGPWNLWTVLHLRNPRAYSSYWKYVDRYFAIEEDEYGRHPYGVLEKMKQELSIRLQSEIYNIPKTVVAGFVPPVVRQSRYVELAGKEKKLYRDFADNMLAVLPDASVWMASTSITAALDLRRFLTCPKLFGDDLDIGAAFREAVDIAENIDPHMVIFSEFKEQFPLWQAYLKDNGYPCYIIRGGMSHAEISIAINEHARKSTSDVPNFLLCTTAVAESFDVKSPRSMCFVGFPWANWMNKQAEGRLTRGEKDYCTAYYVMHRNTIEEEVMMVLEKNAAMTGVVISENT